MEQETSFPHLYNGDAVWSEFYKLVNLKQFLTSNKAFSNGFT